MMSTWIPGPSEAWAPSAEELPHLEALRDCVRAGFYFVLLRDVDNQIMAVHAERRDRGVVDTITAASLEQTVVTRIRVEDYPLGHPLWQSMGSVAEVIGELLELPPHGSPGAPVLALRESLLWRLGDML